MTIKPGKSFLEKRSEWIQQQLWGQRFCNVWKNISVFSETVQMPSQLTQAMIYLTLKIMTNRFVDYFRETRINMKPIKLPHKLQNSICFEKLRWPRSQTEIFSEQTVDQFKSATRKIAAMIGLILIFVCRTSPLNVASYSLHYRKQILRHVLYYIEL